MSEQLAKQIIKGLYNRKGFDDWWDNLDKDIQADILADITVTVYNALMSLVHGHDKTTA